MFIKIADHVVAINEGEIQPFTPFDRFQTRPYGSNYSSLSLNFVKSSDWERTILETGADQQKAISRLIGTDISLENEQTWWLNQRFRVFVMDTLQPKLHFLGIVADTIQDFAQVIREEIRVPLFLLAAYQLAQHGGLCLHGSSFAINGIGGIITGLSGAGKSTATGLIQPDYLYSDDSATITGISTGNLTLHGTPLGGRTDGPGTAPLKGIFFATKAERLSIREMPVNEARIRLLYEHHAYFRLFFEPTRRLYFSLMNQLLQQIPCYELSFSLNDLPRDAVASLLEAKK